MKRGLISKSNVGTAGTLYAASRLSRRGYRVGLTLGSTEDIDIVVSSADRTRSVSVQVKTMGEKSKPEWLLNEKAETLTRPDIVYMLVDYRKPTLPSLYIVPSIVVAEGAAQEHADWLAAPGKHGQPHNECAQRVFCVEMATLYPERWDILGLDADADGR